MTYEPERLFNEYGAANTEAASNIDNIIDPAIERVVDYCLTDNIDLRDAMGYCILAVTNRLCEASLRKAIEMRKAQRLIDTLVKNP